MSEQTALQRKESGRNSCGDGEKATERVSTAKAKTRLTCTQARTQGSIARAKDEEVPRCHEHW